jgi:uncharacterized protein YbaP (TraB family)
MRNRVFALTVAAFLFCAHACAQSSVWKVSKGGHSLYLGGSVHVLRASDVPLPKEFDAAFEKSDVLVFEIDMEEMASPDVMRDILLRAALPKGKTLKTELLSPKAYERLAGKCAELGISVNNVSPFTPFMTVMMLTTPQLQKLGFVLPGVDAYYLANARQKDKKLLFRVCARLPVL